MDAIKRMVQTSLSLLPSRPTTDPLIETPGTSPSSPSRAAKKQINYAESDDDEEDIVFKPLSGNGRATKRRKISVKDDASDEEFGLDEATLAALESDDGTSAFVAFELPLYR